MRRFVVSLTTMTYEIVEAVDAGRVDDHGFLVFTDEAGDTVAAFNQDSVLSVIRKADVA